MDPILARKIINWLIVFLNRHFLEYPNTISPIEEFPFRPKARMEPIVWAYANTRSDMVAALMSEGAESKNYRRAFARSRLLERRYGDRLSEYLAPYRGKPGPMVAWHRWYAAGAIFSEE